MGFIYIWRDRLRNMFYVGSHDGETNDGYVSSSKWFNAEHRYRPTDFRRKIVSFVDSDKLKLEEYRYLKMIKDDEFGKRYYNLRIGKPKGVAPWNKGKSLSPETRSKISEGRKGQATWNKGLPNSVSAENGKKSSEKLRVAALGRRMQIVDGKRTWVYPK